MRYKYIVLALCCTFCIILFSSIPDKEFFGGGSSLQKIIFNIAHIPFYTALTFFYLIAFSGARFKRYAFKINLALLALLVIFAISDEIHQAFVSGRSSSLMDFTLDVLGIAFGFYLSLKKQFIREQIKNNKYL